MSGSIPLNPLPPEFQMFFEDPNDPKRPPEEVEVRELRVEPLDHGRIRVYLTLSPYQQRPHINLTVWNAQQQPVAELLIVEPVNPRMEFTLYLREEAPAGSYRVAASVQYPPPGFKFQLPEEGEEIPLELPPMREVTRAETTFTLEAPTS
ncbi:MAG: hypothetical protein GXO36_05755 [Chloroflexi bacterium]|nr:hypothetical protein [Chloroflexota bacterium]